ncbi:MAG TPA: response regulator, partial [Candidatus Acidoferrum sp.]|nr:response regulator [Candidatus Acidoferrum sp.]
MPEQSSGPPGFGDLLERGQEALSELAELGRGLARDLEAKQGELNHARSELNKARTDLNQAKNDISQAKAELAQTQTQLKQAQAQSSQIQAQWTQTLTRQRQLEQELEAFRTAQKTWGSERDRLLAEAGQLHQAHDALRHAHDTLRQDMAALQAAHDEKVGQLAGLHEEREELQNLHAQVTDQAGKLAADWNARRQALTSENQRLSAELQEARRTFSGAQEREKQWKDQVWKLQDEVRTLRGAGGRVTLTAEQGHDLLSQLNAIIGFTEVLLDEAGSRATAAERQEFLQNIRDSGARLAAYVDRLTGQAASGAATAEGPFVKPGPGAIPVLVAASDPELRERIEPFLNRAGYRVEFAGDLQSALKMAVALQPLAVVIDTDLPPKGAQGLIDELLFEPRTKDIPVVLTVKNDEEPAGVSLGQYDFLRKPINRQQLVQVMAKYDLLAERRRASKMPTSVLVIDDDPKNTRLVQAMLKPYNVDVLVAHDGTSGIKLAKSRKPDLIILDLMMPEVDGFAVVSELRSDPTTERTPVLIYSAK